MRRRRGVLLKIHGKLERRGENTRTVKEGGGVMGVWVAKGIICRLETKKATEKRRQALKAEGGTCSDDKEQRKHAEMRA